MPTAIRRLLQFAAVSLGVALAVGGVPSYAAPTEQTLAEVPTEGSSTNSVAAGDDVLLARIPFEVDRNRTILKVQVGGSRPLRLILDTGMPMDGVYLFHKELQGEIALENAIEVLIPGAGGGEPSKGVMAESVPVSSGDVVFGRQRAIVSLSEQTQGFPTDGVIGWSLFGHYAVELDYDKMLITLHPSGTFAPDSSWHAIPMKLRKSIPWVTASVDVLGAGSVPVECYIDFASGEAVELLVHSDAKFPIPENLETTYL